MMVKEQARRRSRGSRLTFRAIAMHPVQESLLPLLERAVTSSCRVLSSLRPLGRGGQQHLSWMYGWTGDGSIPDMTLRLTIMMVENLIQADALAHAEAEVRKLIRGSPRPSRQPEGVEASTRISPTVLADTSGVFERVRQSHRVRLTPQSEMVARERMRSFFGSALLLQRFSSRHPILGVTGEPPSLL